MQELTLSVGEVRFLLASEPPPEGIRRDDPEPHPPEPLPRPQVPEPEVPRLPQSKERPAPMPPTITANRSSQSRPPPP